MSDQYEIDDSLPTPTPDETARLMREGSRNKVAVWKRLLPAWAVSIGLHLFVLPFVLGLTVVFADSLFVPGGWTEVREKNVGAVPYSLMIEDRDFPVVQVEEKSVPLRPMAKQESIATAPNVPQTKSASLPQQLVIPGQVVAVQPGQITVKLLVDCTRRVVQTDENTPVYRVGELCYVAFDGQLDDPSASTTTNNAFFKHARTNARLLPRELWQPKPSQADASGNVIIKQSVSNMLSGQDLSGSGSAAGSPYGYLGVALSTETARVKIIEVIPTTGASKAGVMEGDMILSLNGEMIEDGEHFAAALHRHQPGEMISLRVRRDDKEIELKATLGKRVRGRD